MKIFLAGHKGLVGSAILRSLKRNGFNKIITVDKKRLNLLDQKKVLSFLKKNKPDIVIIAAARVGGIHANNTFGGNFIYENIQIQTNLIHGSYLNKIKNLIFLGSSCIYPKSAKQPLKEEYLLGGIQEETTILKTPCITIRKNTERPETIKAKTNILTNYSLNKINNAIQKSLNKKILWKNIYGKNVSNKIFKIIKKDYEKNKK